jgi:hypothetical protein
VTIGTYAGKTFRFSVDNGVVFHNTYATDGTKLHYETVAGPTKGADEDVDLHAAEVSPGVFIVGWVEQSGITGPGPSALSPISPPGDPLLLIGLPALPVASACPISLTAVALAA